MPCGDGGEEGDPAAIFALCQCGKSSSLLARVLDCAICTFTHFAPVVCTLCTSLLRPLHQSYALSALVVCTSRLHQLFAPSALGFCTLCTLCPTLCTRRFMFTREVHAWLISHIMSHDTNDSTCAPAGPAELACICAFLGGSRAQADLTMTEIAGCSWALAQLNTFDEGLFTLLSQRVSADLAKCGWSELADITRAFAKFGFMPGALPCFSPRLALKADCSATNGPGCLGDCSAHAALSKDILVAPSACIIYAIMVYVACLRHCLPAALPLTIPVKLGDSCWATSLCTPTAKRKST